MPERLQSLADPPRQRLAGLRDGEIGDVAKAALGPWWPPFNLHRVLARNPETLASWIGFGTHILRNNSLDAESRELVILRIAANADCAYEWGQHVRAAERIGMSAEVIERVIAGPAATGWSDLERALLTGVDEFMSGWSLSDATYAQLEQSLSDRQLLDYMFLIGEFIMVALLLNGFRVEPDAGLPRFPAREGP